VRSMWLVTILNAISYSMLIYILAVGFSLIYGLARVVNLTHGSMFLVGAYIAIDIARSHNFVLAGLGAVALVCGIALVLDRIIKKFLFGKELDQVLLTFGWIYIIDDIARLIWGGGVYSIVKPSVLNDSVSLFGFIFPSYRLMIVAVGLTVAILLWLIIERTRLGMIIRAGIDDPEMVNNLGINVKRYFTTVFAIGGFLAGVAGWLGAGVMTITIGLDFDILVITLIVVVVGGMGSLAGAFVASLIICFADILVRQYAPVYGAYTVYGLLFAILALRPSGLFGVKE
jgi:branched-chain amino acid transport system permease protein